VKQNDYPDWPDFKFLIISNKTTPKSSVSIINSSLSTDLHHAHRIRNYHELQKIVAQAANLGIINKKDCFGESALAKAVYFGNDFLVKLLLAKGAYVGVLDSKKKTILHYIGNLKDKGLIEDLVKKCAEDGIINHKDQDGYKPLDVEFFYNNYYNMRLLLKYGANINITDNFYYICCRVQDDETQECLIKKYAELGIINQQDSHGYSPLALSIIHSNNKITSLLLKHGADPKDANITEYAQNLLSGDFEDSSSEE
jgi:ankyrin repeat protein